MGAALPPELSPATASQFDSSEAASFPIPHSNGTSANSISCDVLQDPVSPIGRISPKKQKPNEDSSEADAVASTKSVSISEEPSVVDQTDIDFAKEGEESMLQNKLMEATNSFVDPVLKEEVAIKEETQGTISTSESFDELSSLSNGRSTPPERHPASDDGIPSLTEIDSDASGWGKVIGDSLLGVPPALEQASSNFVAAPIRKLHTFFMVRIPKPADNKAKADIKMAEMHLKEMTEKRDFLNAALQMKRANRHEVIERLKAAREKERTIRESIKDKRKETDPLHAALNKIRETGRFARERGQDLCSSEKELDDRIASLDSRIAHDTITLQEEKQIVREIRQLNASRDQVCANAVIHAEVQETLGQKDEIQARLKPLLGELDGLRREHQIAGSKIAVIEEECNVSDEDIFELLKQRDAANNTRQEAFVALQTLLKSESSRNDSFYQTRREIQLAKQCALQNNKKAVEEICNTQMDKVLALWTNNSNFRAEYIKNNEMSTLKRLETLDGRALGPDEEPPLLVSINDSIAPMPDSRVGSESAQLANSNIPTEKVKVRQVVNESKNSQSVKLSNGKLLPRQITVEPERASVVSASNTSEIPDRLPVPYSQGIIEDNEAKEVEAAQLKEKRRQQEMAKAKEAEERKKKQAERSQAKALSRAQKEAERREKEREKKAHKKAATAAAVASRKGTGNQAETTVEEKVETVEASVEKVSPPSEDKVSSRRRKKPMLQRPRASRASIMNLSTKKTGRPFQIWLLIAAVTAVTILLLTGLLLFYLRSS